MDKVQLELKYLQNLKEERNDIWPKNGYTCRPYACASARYHLIEAMEKANAYLKFAEAA